MKNLLHILKNDRQGLLGLLAVAVAAGIFFFANGTEEEGHGMDVEGLDGNEKAQRAKGNISKKDTYYNVPAKDVRLQAFDPNTADSTVLLGLGLQPWQVRSIYKYRAGGGTYTRPEDFARLYGLSAKKYRQLLPYIRISDDYRPASEIYYTKKTVGNKGTNGHFQSSDSSGTATSFTYPPKLQKGQTIALNASDTTALRKVPGIGAHFARKVTQYRDKLGGFVSTEQLLEIQDFPESALPYFTVGETDKIQRLNINTATNEQLRRHPYINYLMARQICDYRRLHGNISSLDALQLLPTFKPAIIQKLKPYITY
ncbi:MAG: helix-hairpin-helix domain-containing protein [Bacteroidales bacterium]|nr:helix-hairpin-helix domain-containing protein [Bacteroidales bacterium]MCM1148038.1 helix-hairpin-helix domain-containing protein [Bacteroidales bacterium]MCM1206855.1 helix-hairpin-helix domain-containing protein [Bacillota bacterium]MCM1511004.1 helix-hairpin-helix domain-containing protein [Clostridium sp.]